MERCVILTAQATLSSVCCGERGLPRMFMRKQLALALLVAVALAATAIPAAAVNPATGTLSNGDTIEIVIDAPSDGDEVPPTGDPLEITTDTLMAFIDGRRIDLGSRQKSLYAKYQQKYRQLGLIE